jgi:hypothetical protein
LQAFGAEMVHYANLIGAELEREGAEALSRGDEPEHTADAIARARRACFERFQQEQAAGQLNEQVRRRDRSVLAAIMLTVASVGLGIMPNFLHSAWQRTLLAMLIVVGVTGLALTWAGRSIRRISSTDE